jgi:hypothetical protein
VPTPRTTVRPRPESRRFARVLALVFTALFGIIFVMLAFAT